MHLKRADTSVHVHRLYKVVVSQMSYVRSCLLCQIWKHRGFWENIKLQMLTTHDVSAWNAMPFLGHVKCGQKESE